MAQVTLISGPERRRRWSSQDRARILSAIEAPGAVVADVPASSPAPPSVSAGEPGVITVELNEARVRICVGAPATLIAATLKALRS